MTKGFFFFLLIPPSAALANERQEGVNPKSCLLLHALKEKGKVGGAICGKTGGLAETATGGVARRDKGDGV